MREISIQQHEIPFLLDEFLNFIGIENFQQKIEDINREIQFENGNYLYLNYWVFPKIKFWKDLEEAIKLSNQKQIFSNDILRKINRPIEIAKKISILQNSFPKETKKEITSRMLAKDNCESILYEIDVAAHFWQLGFNIEWFSSNQGSKIPEFICSNKEQTFEVECKSQSADLGRMIKKTEFYRFSDKLLKRLEKIQIDSIIIDISIHERMVKDFNWGDEIIREIYGMVEKREETKSFSDFTKIQITYLEKNTFHGNEIDKIRKDLWSINSHIVIVSKENNKMFSNIIGIKITSQTSDKFLSGIYSDLRKASSQFTGNHQAIINCYIPEIYSFQGLENNSALKNMTFLFFNKHRSEYISAITYTSDIIFINSNEEKTSSYSPSLLFTNPYYNPKNFGTIIDPIIFT